MTKKPEARSEMSCGGVVPSRPNCGKRSIYPSRRAMSLPSAVIISNSRRASMATLRLRSPSRLFASRSAFRPPGAAADVGIADDPLMAAESFYELLGIPENGSEEDIKRAYKRLAKKHHPDVSSPDCAKECIQIFIMVQKAYETLSDPDCRALYDRYLARGLQFAFSSRRQFDQDMEEKCGWKIGWQAQLIELKMRSLSKNYSNNISWGARMRRQRAESSAD